MLRVIRLLMLSSLFVPTTGASGLALPKQHNDDNVYNRIARVQGQVIVLNHPTLGRTPAASTYLVFQRQGCKDCLVATWTDPDGKYQLFLGRGRYKLIVRDVRGGLTPSVNMLAPLQTRTLNVTGFKRDYTFDIQLVIPSEHEAPSRPNATPN